MLLLRKGVGNNTHMGGVYGSRGLAAQGSKALVNRNQNPNPLGKAIAEQLRSVDVKDSVAIDQVLNPQVNEKTS